MTSCRNVPWIGGHSVVSLHHCINQKSQNFPSIWRFPHTMESGMSVTAYRIRGALCFSSLPPMTCQKITVNAVFLISSYDDRTFGLASMLIILFKYYCFIMCIVCFEIIHSIWLCYRNFLFAYFVFFF